MGGVDSYALLGTFGTGSCWITLSVGSDAGLLARQSEELAAKFQK